MPETITIEGDQVHLTNGDGTRCTAELGRWIHQVNTYSIHGMTDQPIPDNGKYHVTCGKSEIWIIELKPELRRILWISKDSPVPYGPEAAYDIRCLATPYVILKIPLIGGRIIPRVEVFYRTEPLSSLDGPGGALYWCNLLNVSPHSYDCTAWFCTQYLGAESMSTDLASTLSAVVTHLWGGVFTRSSEAHEGSSAFSKAVQERIDPRVTDVDRWEAESDKDPRFVGLQSKKALGSKNGANQVQNGKENEKGPTTGDPGDKE